MQAARHAFWVVALTVAAGCGPSKGPSRWVTAQSAVVRCTVAGRDLAPPLLLELPTPPLATGLYARGLDPMALNDLGFEREQPACATLEAPTLAELETVEAGLQTLVEIDDKVGIAAMLVAGQCSCEVAAQMGYRELVGLCSGMPTQRDCEIAGRDGAMRTALQPLLDALRTTAIPRIHWRLSGVTDRPGWAAEQLPKLLDRHQGGSTVYVPGQPVPQRGHFELLRTLLKTESVIAVASQDGGRAVLVVREIGDELVFDHFSVPVVGAFRLRLLTAADNMRPEVIVDALARPVATAALPADPKGGSFIHFDRRLLEQVDGALIAQSVLADRRYDPEAEQRREPPVLVDWVTLQIPFGHHGERLQGRFGLSDDGQAWAQALVPGRLSPTVDELRTSDPAELVYGAPANGPTLPFFVRGTNANAAWIHGAHGLAEAMRQVEMSHPQTVAGTTDAWAFDLPTGPYVPGVVAPHGLSGAVELLGRKPYRLEAGFDPARTVVTVDLRPR